MSHFPLPRFKNIIKPPRRARINWTHPLTRGLIGAWPCLEGMGTLIESKATYAPGTLVLPGSIPWDYLPNGTAPRYNTTCYIDLLNPFALPSTFSVVTWASTLSVSGNRAVASFRSTTTGGAAGFQLDQNGADGRFICGRTGNLSTATYTTAFAVGVWTHLVGVFDGTNSDLYVNGVIGSHSGTYAAPSNINSLNVGAIVNGGTGRSLQWSGNIEGLLIYNRVLSIDEIQWLKTSPYIFYDFAPFNTPLVSISAASTARSWSQIIG